MSIELSSTDIRIYFNYVFLLVFLGNQNNISAKITIAVGNQYPLDQTNLVIRSFMMEERVRT